MKVSPLCLSIILMAALFAQASPSARDSDTSTCCFQYLSRQLPWTHVKDYFYTSSLCPQPAVVFITQRNRIVCAKPDAGWVKEYVNRLELQ